MQATYKKAFHNNGGSRGSANPKFHNRRTSHGIGWSNGRGNKLVCQHCGKVGHVPVKGYHYFDISFQGLVSTSQNNSQHRAYAPSTSTVTDLAWYLNRGGTTHITADMNNLLAKFNYKGKEEFVISKMVLKFTFHMLVPVVLGM
ncbi:hypothetical protein PanWU01x14_102290 [Parasponia andersonii]|uniref:Zinc finger, CCHC-type n=1 Tax=Parasponia andersonii TaxID=3476 RepID=A0A2P5D2T0_PARAD|nr:hypothetical protein PanWU01x14_102290 [Parasponia andersonii]